MVQRYDGTPRLFAYFMEYDTLDRPLEVARLDAKHDAVGVPEISFDDFQTGVLPSLRKKLDITIDQAVEKVYKVCVQKKVIVGGRFADYQSTPAQIKTDSKKNPSGNSPKVNEDTIYAPLGNLWEKIVEIAQKELNLNPSIVFNHTPHAHPYVERGEAIRPDALSVVIESKMPNRFADDSLYYFCNAAIIKEDRIFDSSKSVHEQIGKTLLNGNVVFANDPLRRGLYSLTSDNDKLRVWFFCRSGVIVSKPLDWIKDVKVFIAVIIRLSFASHTSLGFDETISRYWIHKGSENSKKEMYDNNLQYRIQVGLKRYRTEGMPLSDRSANFFAGFGTRIFRAIETDVQWTDIRNNETRVSLKIYWPKVGGILEGNVIKELFDKAMRKRESTSWLPVVLIAAIVTIDDAEVPDPNNESSPVADQTTQFVRASLNNETCDFYPGHVYTKQRRAGTNSVRGSSRLKSTGGLRTAARMDSVTGISSDNYVNPNIKDFLAIFWVERVQYRIVFDGVGKPLDELDKMHNIFVGFRDGFKGVRKLHEYGYIHRNIGIKNILFFEYFRGETSVVQLTDYAGVRSISKCRNDEQILAGTRACMALEILLRRYMYFNSNAAPDTRTLSHADFVAESEVLEQSDSEEESWDFHSNALHDVEPFFWMVLWFLFYRVPKKSDIDIMQLHAQMDVGYNIFEDTSTQKFGHPSTIRSQCLTLGGEGLKSCLEVIPEDFQDVGLHNCATQLAKHVLRCYIKLEGAPDFNGAETPSLLTKLPDWAYDGFDSIFDIYCKKLDKTNIHVADAIRPPIMNI